MSEMQAAELLFLLEQRLDVIEVGMRVLVFTVALATASVFGSMMHRWVRGH